MSNAPRQDVQKSKGTWEPRLPGKNAQAQKRPMRLTELRAVQWVSRHTFAAWVASLALSWLIPLLVLTP